MKKKKHDDRYILVDSVVSLRFLKLEHERRFFESLMRAPFNCNCKNDMENFAAQTLIRSKSTGTNTKGTKIKRL